jgi:hypothetical protein
MKNLLLTICAIAICWSSFAQTRKDFDEVMPNAALLGVQNHHWFFIDGIAGVEIGGQWGVINEKGEIIIEAKYQYIDIFQEGLAYFYQDDLVGFINKKGEVTIKAQFKEARGFSEGRAAFLDETTNQWGFIDTSGTIVIPPKYTMVRDFSEGTALVNIGGICFYEFCVEWGGGLVGVIDLDGNEIVPIEYQYGYSSKDGLINLQKTNGVDHEQEMDGVTITFYKSGNAGAVNNKGEVVIPFDYTFLYPSCKGVMQAGIMQEGVELKGIIDVYQNIIVPFQECQYYYECDNLEMYSVPNNGHYIMIIKEKTKGLYKDGQLLLEPIFKDFYYINDDTFVAVKEIAGRDEYAIVRADLSTIHDFGSFQSDFGSFEFYGDNRFLTFTDGTILQLDTLK